MRERRTARVILFDPARRVLLMKGRLPSAPNSAGGWFTVGGGLEGAEDVQAAAAREIVEETGILDAVIGPVVGRAEQIHHDRKGRPVRVRETFVLARCGGADLSRAGWRALEREFVDDMRWWTLSELTACADQVFPADLRNRVEAACRHPFMAGGVPLSPGSQCPGLKEQDRC